MFIYFSKNLENTIRSDIPYSHILKTHIASFTKEVVQLCKYHKEQQNKIDGVDNLPEKLYSKNWQKQSSSTITNTYKMKKNMMYTSQVHRAMMILFLEHFLLQSVKYLKNLWSQRR